MTAPEFDSDRRNGAERRQFSYYVHIPERRSGRDRRSGKDRRYTVGNKRGKVNQGGAMTDSFYRKR
jgi:hypothetical protein